MHETPSEIRVTIQFQNITDALSRDIERRVHERVAQLRRSYFRQILKKRGAQIAISGVMERNRHGRYTGRLHFQMDNKSFRYETDVPFSEPLDVVGHAFKRLKEHLASSPQPH